MRQIGPEDRSLGWSVERIRSDYDKLWECSEKGLALPEDCRMKVLHLLDVKAGEKLLDIGCGSGFLLEEAKQRGAIPFGIDISLKAIENARKRLPGADLVSAPAEELPWPNAHFDCIANVGSLEHFIDPAASLRESARVLKENGRAAFLVPNAFYLFHVMKAWLLGKGHEAGQWIERTGTRGCWSKLIEANAFKVKAVKKYNLPYAVMPWWYRPAYHLMTVNMSWCFIFLCTKAHSPVKSPA